LDTLEWKDVKMEKASVLKQKNIFGLIPITNSKIDMNKAHVFGHKIIVIAYKRSFVKYDSLGEMNFDKEPSLIKHEGIYMFGGVIGEMATDY